MKNNRAKKVITDDIENNFLKMLADLDNTAPDPIRKKKSATSLIIENRAQIVRLIEKGYAVEQIILNMAKIKLEISASTLRSTLRTTDEEGNRIGTTRVKVKSKNGSKTTARSSKPPSEKPQGTASGVAQETVSEAPEILITAIPAVDVSNTSGTARDKPVDALDKIFVEAPKVDTQEEQMMPEASYAQQSGVFVPASSKRANKIENDL